MGSWSRRRILTAFGASALAVPLFRGLAAQIAHADTGTFPLRFVFMFTGNGMLPSHWVPPSGGEADFTLAPALVPLMPHRNKLLLVHGVSGGNGHHIGMSETTTGKPSRGADTDGRAGGGPSIDQYLAEEWRGTTPLRSLETGVFPGNDANDQTSYAPSGLPVPAIGSPVGAFERVFAVTNESPERAMRRRNRRASILDVTATDLAAIQSRLGPDARALVDEHLTLVRQREMDLLAPYTPIMCDLPPAPGATPDIQSAWRAHNETIAAAFRCGTTRVATLRCGGWGGAGGYAALGFEDGHHNVSHGGTADPDGDSLEIERWHAQQFADLLTLLDAVPEGSGTLLDSTVAVWFSELGLGPVNNHGRMDIPTVIAGGRCAGFKNGAYLNLGGVAYQDFLFTLARTLGDPGLARFGDAGTAVIPELFV